jgi:hypothetical protein
MHPQLQTLLDDLAAVRARWARLAAATPDDRWATRARVDAWSVAENIAHLNLTARAMQPLLEAATEQARALGARPVRLRRSVLGAILSATVGPVPRLLGVQLGRVRTPPPFVPTGDEPRAMISAEFERHLAAHDAGIRAADGLAIDQVRIDSPFAPGTKYDAYSGWMVVVRHAHRHLAQAERVWGE